jgi:hypothetical protein
MRRSLFVLLSVLFLLCGCGNSVYPYEVTKPVVIDEKDIISVSYDGEDVYIAKGGETVAVIEDSKLVFWPISNDSLSAAILVNPDGTETGGYNLFSLYYYKDELIHIADGICDCKLSDGGESVAYYVSTDSIDVEYADAYLDKYVWNGGKSTFVINNNIKGRIEFTPDGKSFLYADGDNEDYSYDWYYYNDGDPVLAASDINLKAVSNDAKFIYGYSEDEFFVQTGCEGERQKLADEYETEFYGIFFNDDNTQIMYNAGSDFYISINGEKPQAISESLKDWVWYDYGNTSYSHPVGDDFRGRYYLSSDDSIYKINEKYKAEFIADFVYDPHMTADGEKIVYYTKDRDLSLAIVTVDLKNPSKPKKTVFEDTFASDVSSFAVSNDGNTIYFVNKEEELFVIKGGVKTFIGSGDEAFESIKDDLKRDGITHTAGPIPSPFPL